MIIPIVVKAYSHMQLGESLKQIHCAKCGRTYFYTIVRLGTGRGDSLYGTDDAGAQRRAQARAEAELQRPLEHDVEPVACPDCGWYQPEMVREWGRRRYLWLLRLGVLMPIVCEMAIGVAWGFAAKRHLTQVFSSVLVALAIVAPIMGIALLVWREFLRRQFDPNTPALRHMTPPLGTPPAMVSVGEPDAQGQIMISPARKTKAEIQNGWLTWRWEVRSLPVICCECMGKADQEVAVPLGLHLQLPVYLCRRCSEELTRCRWQWGFACVPIIGALTILFSYGFFVLLIPVDYQDAHIAFGIIGSVFTIPFAVPIISAILARPYRVRQLDTRRLVAQFKFRNRRYTEAMAATIESQ